MANIDASTFEAVSNSNFKVLGETPAQYSNLILSNAISHQQKINEIGAASLGQIIKGLIEVDAIEAVSTSKILSGNELATTMLQLAAGTVTAGRSYDTITRRPDAV